MRLRCSHMQDKFSNDEAEINDVLGAKWVKGSITNKIEQTFFEKYI